MPAQKNVNEIPAERLKQYEKLVTMLADVELKGASMPYTSCNGNMFTYLDAFGNMALRLSKEDRDAFMAEHKAGLMLSHGVIMKEYVSVPDELFMNTRKMKKYMGMSLAYVQTLKPKTAKKGK